jgi:cytochrome c556
MQYSSRERPIGEIMAQTFIVLIAIVAALGSGGAARQSDPPAGPVPVLDNVDLMDLMLKPAYDELQRTMAQPPADRQAWAALYQRAARLAELENLLFFRTRAGEARQLEWAAKAARARQASAEVAEAALAGLRNARTSDFAAVRTAFPAVSDGCTACHRAFAREAPVIKP